MAAIGVSTQAGSVGLKPHGGKRDPRMSGIVRNPVLLRDFIRGDFECLIWRETDFDVVAILKTRSVF